jgi:hypothetical protein
MNNLEAVFPTDRSLVPPIYSTQLPVGTAQTLIMAQLSVFFLQVLTLNTFPSVRFELFTAAAMKNVVFWDIKTQFVLQRRHITSPLQSPAS